MGTNDLNVCENCQRDVSSGDGSYIDSPSGSLDKFLCNECLAKIKDEALDKRAEAFYYDILNVLQGALREDFEVTGYEKIRELALQLISAEFEVISQMEHDRMITLISSMFFRAMPLR